MSFMFEAISQRASQHESNIATQDAKNNSLTWFHCSLILCIAVIWSQESATSAFYFTGSVAKFWLMLKCRIADHSIPSLDEVCNSAWSLCLFVWSARLHALYKCFILICSCLVICMLCIVHGFMLMYYHLCWSSECPIPMLCWEIQSNRSRDRKECLMEVLWPSSGIKR